MRTGSKQLLLIAGATVLTAALYFAPRVVVRKDSISNISSDEFSFDALATEAKGQLKRQEAEQINSVEAAT